MRNEKEAEPAGGYTQLMDPSLFSGTYLDLLTEVVTSSYLGGLIRSAIFSYNGRRGRCHGWNRLSLLTIHTHQLFFKKMQMHDEAKAGEVNPTATRQTDSSSEPRRAFQTSPNRNA